MVTMKWGEKKKEVCEITHNLRSCLLFLPVKLKLDKHKTHKIPLNKAVLPLGMNGFAAFPVPSFLYAQYDNPISKSKN